MPIYRRFNMIVLIDNENYMIRLCKDTPKIHGFHPSYPNWKNLVKLLNDMDEMVVLSGKEQEQWLDDNNIYYVHVEAKPKESFETFKKRMYRQIEENKEYIETSTSFGKLVFALTKGNMVKGNVSTDNIVEVWRRNSDNKYSVRFDLPDNVSDHTYYLLVRVIRKIFEKEVNCSSEDGKVTVDELVEGSFNLFTADTLPGVAARMLVLEELFNNGYVKVLPNEDEYPEPECSNCPYECPCDADPEECPLDKEQEENEHDAEPQEKDWKEYSQEEFDALSDEDKEKVINQALDEVIPTVAAMLLKLDL